MSRNARQSKILNIISSQDVETQDELVELLRSGGFDVTQATISRDIKELGLIKTLTENGRYKYVTKQTIDTKVSSKLLNMFCEAVVSVETANNLIVVKTLSDSASAVAGAIEQFNIDGVVGVLADRSTVLVVASGVSKAEIIAEKLIKLQNS